MWGICGIVRSVEQKVILPLGKTSQNYDENASCYKRYSSGIRQNCWLSRLTKVFTRISSFVLSTSLIRANHSKVSCQSAWLLQLSFTVDNASALLIWAQPNFTYSTFLKRQLRAQFETRFQNCYLVLVTCVRCLS